jgi:AP-3 complex subunit delta-1
MSAAKDVISGLFKKTLNDMVKGIRSCKTNEAAYVSQCISEIKDELKSTDQHVKVLDVHIFFC